ncbi:anti-sigma factor [Halocola ammonii]
MDTKEYISSGILEEYVMGTASEQERQEVECLSSIYPEISEELNALESSLEQFAQLKAIEPSEGMREKVLVKVDAQPRKLVKMAERGEHRKTEEITRSTNNNWKVAAAAAAVLLVAVSVWLFAKQGQISDVIAENQSLQDQVDELRGEQIQNQEQLAAVEQQLKVISNPTTQSIELTGTDLEPGARSLVYWNKNSQETFVRVESLPKPPSDKQYQLWALKDGKPIDAGVFEVDGSTATLQNVKAVAAADAFAVTLEKRGGSESPNLEAMYLMGKIKS